MHTFWKEKKNKQVVKLMIICHGTIILLLVSLIFLLYILDIDVFSPAGNNHQVNIYLLSLLLISKPKTKKKSNFI